MHMERIESGCGCDRLQNTASLMRVEDAVNRALALVAPLAETETLPLGKTRGRTSAAHVSAPCALPRFDNAAMDGFALRAADLEGRCCLPIAGTVAAGDVPGPLPDGAALRIFTGAMMPEGADSVVMIEDCIDKGHKVHVERKPGPGANLRLAGSDQALGAPLLPAGQRIAPHHIGLLAANGVDQITVTRRPRVAVFSTGDELRSGPLGPGQIADANRPMLLALAAEAGAEVDDLGILPDDLDATASALAQVAGRYDLIVTSGAVSMGGKDHIRAAFEAAGGQIEGWRVAIKPGKPAMFGKLGPSIVTGLPGNPFAVHVGFHLFVLPQIQRLSGQTPRPFAPVPAIAGFDWTRKAGRAEVFPVRRRGFDGHGTPILERLGRSVSATLLPLSGADGLAIVPATTSEITSGDRLLWRPFCYDGGAQ
ncbi:gephyrin-like molybdotransferase Glp [Primorskyibacter sp. S187A]|uniref:molybdopterin molybdotransferase MoeA n=1 Tax=Primorskyibacter sp. S187A TaxID=3415130 RepID=UPI003C7C0E04